MTLSNCNPSITPNYSISHVANFNASLPLSATNMYYDFLTGITPVMTIFASNDGASALPSGIPGLSLNCLKVKTSNATSNSSSEFVSMSSRSTVQMVELLIIQCFVWGLFAAC
jgi:hypothetical protein